MTVVALRSDRAYAGFAKQSGQGVSTAPSLFPRWLDGTSLEIDAKLEDIWEGDNSRRLSQIIKNGQQVKIKHVCYPRPNELGFIDAAAQGSGSDTVTTATVSTTLSSASLVGATSVSVAANTGLTGTGTIALVIDHGLATEEIATFTLPATGAGPYVLTVANGGALQKAHASGATIQASTLHTITDQADGAYYSIEVSLGDTAGIIIRVRDCKVESIKRSSAAGHLLSYETEWTGIACLVQTSAATITLDAHQPFLYTSGVWTLDGVTTGDALEVQKFDIAQKNNLDWIQTERLIGDASIFGMLNMDVSLDVLFQNGNRIAEVYFGGPSGTADAQAIYLGALILTFTQADGFHSGTYTTVTLAYTKVGIPQPKHDGKAWMQALTATSTSNEGANTFLLQAAVANTTTTAY